MNTTELKSKIHKIIDSIEDAESDPHYIKFHDGRRKSLPVNREFTPGDRNFILSHIRRHKISQKTPGINY